MQGEEQEEESRVVPAPARALSPIFRIGIALIVAVVIPFYWVISLEWPGGSPIHFVRVAFVCFLASFTFVISGMLLFRLLSPLKRSEALPLMPKQAGYFVVAIVMVTVLGMVLYWYDAPAVWRGLQFQANLVILISTTRILVDIGSRQISKILRYGYYATALILGAEALMVMFSGGQAQHG